MNSLVSFWQTGPDWWRHLTVLTVAMMMCLVLLAIRNSRR